MPCPLCRSVPSSAYTSRGFTLPEGLDRHLEGRGNTYACPVMEALLTLANQSMEPTLRAADAAAARGAKADATTD